MENKLFELAVRRRSVRRYTRERLDEAVLDEIMRVALTAPASFGHQPVEFVVVRDKQTIRELAACKSLGGSQIIGADAVIVVMVKLDRGEFWIEDGAIASSYILLAAEQYNVGACWVHIRNRTGRRKSSDEEIREHKGDAGRLSMAKQTVFMTGAGGGMGLESFKAMLPDLGRLYNLVILVRDSEKNRRLFGQYSGQDEITVKYGDLLNKNDVADCVSRSDVCLHIAAFVSSQADYYPKKAMQIIWKRT